MVMLVNLRLDPRNRVIIVGCTAQYVETSAAMALQDSWLRALQVPAVSPQYLMHVDKLSVHNVMFRPPFEAYGEVASNIKVKENRNQPKGVEKIPRCQLQKARRGQTKSTKCTSCFPSSTNDRTGCILRTTTLYETAYQLRFRSW